MSSGGDAARSDTSVVHNPTDLLGIRREYYFKPPKCLVYPFLSVIKDERDLPMVYLFLNILLTSVPMAIAILFFLPPYHWIGAAFFVLNMGFYMKRFILWLHFSEHVKTYQQNSCFGRLLNQFPGLCIAPLFGIPSGMYHLHHVIMHHRENNLFPWDISSTEPYQRDSFVHWLHYWLRFTAAGWLELPYYAIKRSRWDIFWYAISSEIIYFSVIGLCLWYNWVGALWIWVVPYLFASFGLMFGNFSQHIFINPNNPENNYSLTYNCIESTSNSETFNDGYHILHHENSRLHWTELPQKFADSIDKHAQEDSLVFKDVDFFWVGILVMTGQLSKLADATVQLGPKQRTKKELIELFKSRMTPIKRNDTDAMSPSTPSGHEPSSG